MCNTHVDLCSNLSNSPNISIQDLFVELPTIVDVYTIDEKSINLCSKMDEYKSMTEGRTGTGDPVLLVIDDKPSSPFPTSANNQTGRVSAAGRNSQKSEYVQRSYNREPWWPSLSIQRRRRLFLICGHLLGERERKNGEKKKIEYIRNLSERD